MVGSWLSDFNLPGYQWALDSNNLDILMVHTSIWNNFMYCMIHIHMIRVFLFCTCFVSIIRHEFATSANITKNLVFQQFKVDEIIAEFVEIVA
jgi:hypothetical protein